MIQHPEPIVRGRGNRVLSEKKQKELEEGFEKIEVKRIGEGTHEEFHKLLNHLQEIYLK